VEIDEVHWRILGMLQENARVSFSEIGRQVGLTPTAVAERVRRLEDAGVIRGYRVLLDTEALGYPVTAFIRFAVRPGHSAHLVRLCEQLEEVLETHRLTGEDSYVLRVVTASIAHLEALIDRLLPLGQPSTSIVLSTPVRQKVIHPPSQHLGDMRWPFRHEDLASRTGPKLPERPVV
jgi:Lrp/AsnC family leucine-responsive transcriptional regulator